MGSATRGESPRSAGFQPARRFQYSPVGRYTSRHPSHPDLGSIPYFVSTRTHRSQRVFVDNVGREAVDELFRQRDQYGFLLLSFVFMPDHAHFVIAPSGGYTIRQTMRVVKGSIARRVNLARQKDGRSGKRGFGTTRRRRSMS